MDNTCPANELRRFHMKSHRELDCAEFSSPNHVDNAMLWHVGNDGNPTPHFNSSIAESNNAWVSGGVIVHLAL